MSPAFELLFGLRWQIRKDNTPFKTELFQSYLKKSRVIEMAYKLLAGNLGRPFHPFMCTSFFLLRYLSLSPPNVSETIVTYLGTQNERRSFLEIISAKFQPLIRQLPQSLLRVPQSFVQNLRFFKRFLQCQALFFRLSRRLPLFAALRASEYMAYFLAWSPLFRDGNFRSALVFSEGNPHGLALLHLARRSGKKSFFVSHGEPNAPIYPLKCTSALLWGRESFERYQNAGAKIEEPRFLGQSEQYSELRELPQEVTRVGVFLSKMTRTKEISAVIQALSCDYPHAEILLRPHPNFKLTESMRAELAIHPALKFSEGGDPILDARKCDFVLAANTTSHVQILMSGTRSLYCYALEGVDFDRNGFLKEGLIREWKPGLTLEAIRDFYKSIHLFELLSKRLELTISKQESLRIFNDDIFRV